MPACRRREAPAGVGERQAQRGVSAALAPVVVRTGQSCTRARWSSLSQAYRPATSSRPASYHMLPALSGVPPRGTASGQSTRASREERSETHLRVRAGAAAAGGPPRRCGLAMALRRRRARPGSAALAARRPARENPSEAWSNRRCRPRAPRARRCTCPATLHRTRRTGSVRRKVSAFSRAGGSWAVGGRGACRRGAARCG